MINVTLVSAGNKPQTSKRVSTAVGNIISRIIKEVQSNNASAEDHIPQLVAAIHDDPVMLDMMISLNTYGGYITYTNGYQSMTIISTTIPTDMTMQVSVIPDTELIYSFIRSRNLYNLFEAIPECPNCWTGE